MRVLVTGATGFIGRYLINDLIRNYYEVRVLTRQKSYKNKDIDIFLGDVTKEGTIENAFQGIEVVFHNAAYAMDWGIKSEIYNINVNGTRNVANICKKKKIQKLIFTSSAGIYGFPNSIIEINEDFRKNPFNYYHKSKLECEYVLQNYSDLNISIIRPCLVLGAGGDAVKILLKRIERNKMRFIGNGNTYISLVHPNDVVQCLRLAAESIENDVFNAVSFVCTVKELIDKITNLMEIEPISKYIPYFVAYLNAFVNEILTREPSLTRFRVRSFGTNRIIGNKKAIKKLGFKPKYNLNELAEDIVS
jgi:nucleoside-diphosphate-sugar epimerase